MPKISIITINLNNKIGLEKTILSVLSQTGKDFEFIIIDGGSNDGSIELIKKYTDNIKFTLSILNT
jgi:glycosyltransferase involved in cell wall biosynthesis